jgi:hypothetical protein
MDVNLIHITCTEFGWIANVLIKCARTRNFFSNILLELKIFVKS